MTGPRRKRGRLDSRPHAWRAAPNSSSPSDDSRHMLASTSSEMASVGTDSGTNSTRSRRTHPHYAPHTHARHSHSHPPDRARSRGAAPRLRGPSYAGSKPARRKSSSSKAQMVVYTKRSFFNAPPGNASNAAYQCPPQGIRRGMRVRDSGRSRSSHRSSRHRRPTTNTTPTPNPYPMRHPPPPFPFATWDPGKLM
jgi:hypothetical protein